MVKLTFQQQKVERHNSIMYYLIIVLVAITLIYQLRPILSDAQFMWISITSYSVMPGSLMIVSFLLSYRLAKISDYQRRAYLMFSIGAACFFIAEQIWAVYDFVLNEDPFPSEADIFYLLAYPFYFVFLYTSIKPLRKQITKTIMLFSISLSAALLIPSFLVTINEIESDRIFETIIAFFYPVASAIVLIPAIIGIMFLFKKEANASWLLLLFGFIVYVISDTVFLFTVLDESYFDGHPVDLLFLYSFLLLTFSCIYHWKLIKKESYKDNIFYTEEIKFETITKFGAPITLAIVALVIFITLLHSVFYSDAMNFSTNNVLIGLISILGISFIIIIMINKNLTKMVQMRTRELEAQRDTLENLVEQKTEELLKAERLSTIGELSGRLAHDLKNPLSVMKMSVELIKKQPKLTISDAQIQDKLTLIEESIKRISHQIDEVMSFVRYSPLVLSNIPLYDLINESIKKINVPETIKINFNKTNISLNCDGVKMDAVFLNILLNAIQAIEKQGEINITVSRDKNFVIISFSNSGPPIPDEFLERIFEPLFTTKQKGTGLGLASCRNIVQQHGGTIIAHNNPTTFVISIPFDAKPA